MRRYAERTSVTPDATLNQIKKAVLGAGAQGFATQEEEGFALIGFRLAGRLIRFKVEFPDREDREFTHTEVQGWRREPVKARQLWEAAIRQRWRALLLIIKAKIEAAQSGIVDLTTELLPYTVLQSGQTVGEWAESEQRFRAMLSTSGPQEAEALALPAFAEEER